MREDWAVWVVAVGPLGYNCCMADTYLSVVDTNDTIIGRELRSVIHKTGLRHREVHVWLVTPEGQLVFQRRSATKDTYPNLLDASVGGHVEEGQTYLQAALAELKEEAGLDATVEQLIPLCKVDATQIDPEMGIQNTVFRMVYAYRFDDRVSDLVVEAQDGAGFAAHPFEDVLAFGAHREDLVPGLFNDGYLPVWSALRNVIESK